MKNDVFQKLIYQLVSKLFVLPIYRFVFRGNLIGRENIPQKNSFIMVSNHGSLLDPPLLGHAIGRNISFMAKAELFKIPLLGFIIKACGAYPVKRGVVDKNTIKSQKPKLSGDADNILLTTKFTLKNFKQVFNENEFLDLLLTTFYFTFFGTVGAIIFGMFAAQLVNQKFYGRTFMRSILLFPYVGPVVALAYTWTLLLDPNSGTLNALLVNFGIIDKPINLLGQKYMTLNLLGFDIKLRLALTTVIMFEIWRYFPLAFLFILARLQAVPKDLYEAAEVDGAGPLRKFINITLPQITAILSILFMIRFIWNFNKFEDIFLLTGGASGTRTLPINVYQQGFAVSNIGMGSAVSIVIVMLLIIFMIIYFKLIGKRANEI